MVKNERYQLLERLATRIGEVCRTDDRVERGDGDRAQAPSSGAGHARPRRRPRHGVTRAYLGLGSNLGDRLAHLQRAVDALAATTGVRVVAVSHGLRDRAGRRPGAGRLPQRGRRDRDRRSTPRELLAVAHARRAARGARSAPCGGGRARSTSTSCSTATSGSTSRISRSRTRGCTSGRSCSRRCTTSRRTGSEPPAGGWEGVTRHAASIAAPLIQSGPIGRNREEGRGSVNGVEQAGALALVGPGRAGTTIAAALAARGWQVVAVAGRSPDAPSTRGRGRRASARRPSTRRGRGARRGPRDRRRRRTPRSRRSPRSSRRGAARRARHPPVRRARARRARRGAVPRRCAAPAADASRRSRPAWPASPARGARSPATRRSRCSPSSSSSARSRSPTRTGPATTRPRASPSNHLVALLDQVRAGRAGAARGVPPAGPGHGRQRRRRSAPRPRSPGPVARGDVETVRAPPRRAPGRRARRVPRARAPARCELVRAARPRARRRCCGDRRSSASRSCATRCEQARRDGRTVGLVPTMGYFHDGPPVAHARRPRRDRPRRRHAVREPDAVRAERGSRRVPARPRRRRRSRATAEGVDVLFVPTGRGDVPGGAPLTTVHVDRLTEGLCGAARPVHFDGVTTVVTKLFSIVGPCDAFFGRKDYQQLAVIRQMTARSRTSRSTCAAARSCASPTASRCRAATRTSSADERARGPGAVRGAARRRRRGDRGRARRRARSRRWCASDRAATSRSSRSSTPRCATRGRSSRVDDARRRGGAGGRGEGRPGPADRQRGPARSTVPTSTWTSACVTGEQDTRSVP